MKNQNNMKAGGQKAPPSMTARKTKDSVGQGKMAPTKAPSRMGSGSFKQGRK